MLRVKRLATCPRVFLPLAQHLLEHTAAPSVTVTGISDTDSQHQAALSFLEYLKSFGVTRTDKARVMSSTGDEYVYPRIHLSKAMHLQEYIDLL